MAVLEKIQKQTVAVELVNGDVLEQSMDNVEATMARMIELYGSALGEKARVRRDAALHRRTKDGGGFNGNPLGYVTEGDAGTEIAYCEKLRQTINLLEMRHRGLMTRLSYRKAEMRASGHGG